MAVYQVKKIVDFHSPTTTNVQAVAEMFGLGLDTQRKMEIVAPSRIEIHPGQVVYITGGSGAGKSTVLQLLQAKMEDCIALDEVELPQGKAVVDCFAGTLTEGLKWLSLAGLSEAFALLRTAEQLSDGQRYRLRLALALSQRPGAICIDEFCNPLDRVTAAVVAHNVRKCADRYGMTFVVATSHDDLLEDLRPDVVVIKHLGGGCEVYYPGRIRK